MNKSLSSNSTSNWHMRQDFKSRTWAWFTKLRTWFDFT